MLEELYSVATPFLLTIGAILIYSVFIFHFYRFVGRKEIFTVNGDGFVAGLVKVVKFIFLYPAFLLFWIVVLSGLLSLLAQSRPIESIILLSAAIVAAIRITAFYNEQLSLDLAKMLPFTLLGVFLVDGNFISFSDLGRLLDFGVFQTLFYYYVIIIVIELILRFFNIFIGDK